MTTIIDFCKEHLRVLGYICCCLLVAIVIWAALMDTHHAHSWMEKHIPAFWSFFGFIGAGAIIFIAKIVGKTGIQVNDDFYCKSDNSIDNGEGQ